MALVSIGFSYGLNYAFVVAHTPSTTDEIFQYVPQGLAYGLSLPASDIQMYGIRFYNTTTQLGYLTTLALAYVPASSVNTLQADILNPDSLLYSNPDDSVNQIMKMINPQISILTGTETDSSDASGASSGNGVVNQAAAGGAPIGGSAGTSAPVSGSSVGIGMGAVAGAAVYAAAMVYVARRYRRKRQAKRHRRNASESSAERQPNMASITRSSGGRRASYWPVRDSRGQWSRNSGSSGSRGARSAREAGISAPVMAENSLGWN